MQHEEEKGKLRRQAVVTNVKGSLKKKKFCKFTKGEHEFELTEGGGMWHSRMQPNETILEYYARECEQVRKNIEEKKTSLKRYWFKTKVWVIYKCNKCGKLEYQYALPDEYPFPYIKKRKKYNLFD